MWVDLINHRRYGGAVSTGASEGRPGVTVLINTHALYIFHDIKTGEDR